MKKFKSIFFGAEWSDFVFSGQQRKEISEITDLLPGRVEAKNFDSFDLSEIEVIFASWGMMRPTEEQLNQMPKLKAVFYAAGAVDDFAQPFLDRGIHILSAWKANAIPVAEMAVCEIMLSMKNVFAFQRAVRSPEQWTRSLFPAPGNYGETVALIGSGMISTMVKEMLERHDLKVIQVHSFPDKRTVSLEEAFRTAYVVSNHLFDCEDNKKVLTREMFASMRQGATFINTGRGAQVDEEGLCEVLKERPDLTAILDVTAPAEPPVKDSPLYTLPNVHLTPHMAGSWNDEVHRMADYMIADYKRFVNGEPMQNEVTSVLPVPKK